VTITLYGEDLPTFAFVSRADETARAPPLARR
jgi:hypothetical protein